MRYTIQYLILGSMMLLHAVLSGQDRSIVPVDTTSTAADSVSTLVSSADQAFHFFSEEGQAIDTLVGNVVLIQDSLYMTCDYAIVIDDIQAYARGNIVIVHKDSTVIYSDTLRYNGISKTSLLTGEVILDSRGKRLNTDRLLYDLNEERATFTTGGKLVDEISTLDALYGTYDVNIEEALFRYNVQYQDTSILVITDSILYDYQLSKIRFLGPTNIYQDSTTIYNEAGIYDTEIDKAVLSENVQISTQERLIKAGLLVYDGKADTYDMYLDPVIIEPDGSEARGDSIIYNARTEILQLLTNASYISEDQDVQADEIVYDLKNDTYTTTGRSQVVDEGSAIEADTILKTDDGQTFAMGELVILQDTASGSTILCQAIESTENGHKAYSIGGQPLLIYELGDSDSLLLRADTLFTVQTDTTDFFIADGDVSIKKGPISGRSDELIYDKVDSLITMYRDPIMWSDSTQLTADTIVMTMVNDNIESLDLVSNAFIVEQDSDDAYNQVNGDRIDCSIAGEVLENATVVSSAQMIYFIRDENQELKGVNKTQSSSMFFLFADNEIKSVKFYRNPSSEITEYELGLDLSSFIFNGFSWRLNEKPEISIFAAENMTVAR